MVFGFPQPPVKSGADGFLTGSRHIAVPATDGMCVGQGVFPVRKTACQVPHEVDDLFPLRFVGIDLTVGVDEPLPANLLVIPTGCLAEDLREFLADVGDVRQSLRETGDERVRRGHQRYEIAIVFVAEVVFEYQLIPGYETEISRFRRREGDCLLDRNSVSLLQKVSRERGDAAPLL